MKLVGSFALLAFSLIVAGCATRTAPNPAATAPGASAAAVEPKIELLASLAGTSWRVIELDGNQVPEPVSGWDKQCLDFDVDGLRVTGNGGVNRFGGRYTEEGQTLSFGPLAMTRRAGPPVLMDAEQVFTSVLSRVSGWRQDVDKLVLLGSGQRRIALLERVQPVKAKE